MGEESLVKIGYCKECKRDTLQIQGSGLCPTLRKRISHKVGDDHIGASSWYCTLEFPGWDRTERTAEQRLRELEDAVKLIIDWVKGVAPIKPY